MKTFIIQYRLATDQHLHNVHRRFRAHSAGGAIAAAVSYITDVVGFDPVAIYATEVI